MNAFLLSFLLILITSNVSVAVHAAGWNTLCASDGDSNTVGSFIGLAVDTDAYKSVEGAPDEKGVTQAWTLVDERPSNPNPEVNSGPQNSFAGRFLQVLPDSGRSYPGGRGSHLKELSQLYDNAPYVAFKFRVHKKGQGMHSLFLRWTGGDSVGGGDSLYVVLFKRGGRKVVGGHKTLHPAMIPINNGIGNFAGCCYDMTTHACPCYKVRPDNSTCPNREFVETDRAATFGISCPVGPGVMEFVDSPKWYLFAGQEEGDVEDFDSEPWDATCEAEGSNSKDSGRDFPAWDLKAGEYELRIYAREDGTALDGIYITGPNARAPTILQRFKQGESTFCSRGKGSVMKVVLIVVGVVAVAFVALVGFSRTEMGANYLHSMTSSLAARRARAREAVLQYEPMEMNLSPANPVPPPPAAGTTS